MISTIRDVEEELRNRGIRKFEIEEDCENRTLTIKFSGVHWWSFRLLPRIQDVMFDLMRDGPCFTCWKYQTFPYETGRQVRWISVKEMRSNE